MKVEDYIVDSNMQLSDAVAQMTKNAVKGLVVVENEKVVGVFTRRDLVNCSHVFGIRNVPIKAFINENFNYCLNKVDEKYKNSKHTLIPVLNEKKELIDIYFPQIYYCFLLSTKIKHPKLKHFVAHFGILFIIFLVL